MWLFFRAQSLVFTNYIYPINSLQFSHSVVSDSLQPHGLQHARLPCPSPTPRACSNSSSRWCHPTISSSGVPFSSHLQSFPASGAFPMSWFFTSGGQSIGVSALASVLLMNIQNWFPLGLTGSISLQSSAHCKASSDNYFAFLNFFLGMILFTASCTMLQTSIDSSSGTLAIRSNPLNLFITSTV